MQEKNHYQFKILKDLCLFVFIFIGSSYITNSSYQKAIYDQVLAKNEENFLTTIPMLSTLILGDSHVKRSIDTEIIPDSYNYSNNAEDYFYTYKKLKRHLSNKDLHLKIAILQMDIHSFVRQFHLQHYLYIYLPTNIVDNFLTYAGNLKLWLGAKSTTSRQEQLYRGFRALPGHRDLNETLLEERIAHHYQYRNLNAGMKLYFEKIIELLESRDIKILVINYPISKAYFERIPAKTVQDFFNYRASITEKHQDLMMLDYHNLFFTKLEDTGKYFFDFDHLNSEGSKLLSLKLKKEIED